MAGSWARRICACVAACAVTDFASAADMAAPPPPPPPPPPIAAPVAVPIYKWSGFFVGGHLGYGWGSEAITLTATGYASGTIPPSIAPDPHGFVGGVQYGTNWQFDRVVVGTESDFSFTDIRRSQTILTSATNTGEQKLPWFGTTRVRAGYTIQDNLLIYATGGLANGTTEASFSAVGSKAAAAVGSRRKTLWGWGAGAGVEYGVGPWSAKIEFLHYDLGTQTFYAFDAVPGAFIKASTKFAGEMVRVGVDYRFSWTPWELVFGR